jgi:hypothetical protein
VDAAAELMRVLVEELKHLDAEAKPLSDGTTTGIWWYHRHLQGTGARPKKYRNEEKLFAALMDRLRLRGLQVTDEEYYPKEPSRNRRQRCDLVLDFPELGRTWIEVKGAWKHNDRKGRTRNQNYPKHLFAAAEDGSKLLKLDRSLAAHVGLLLIGFDHIEDPIPERDVDIVRQTTALLGWREQFASWNEMFCPNGIVKVWLWLTTVREASGSPPHSSRLDE